MKTSTTELAELQYFGDLQQALADDDRCQPVLVIDLGRLNDNLDTLLATAPPNMGVRVVVKSLPSLPLLRHVMSRLETQRLMTFNLPMLVQLAKDMPLAEQLLGKPFPVAAASQFIDEAPRRALENVQWLIDTNERLEQYEALARDRELTLRISLELDIGLHRGGFSAGHLLQSALHRIDKSEFLELSGFMGYEAHLGKVPATGGLQAQAYRLAMDRYSQCLDQAIGVLGADAVSLLVNNSAGSLTYPLHSEGSAANEMSFGTALLKGTNVDIDLLDDFVPAVFIATPVLKVLARTELPGFEFVGRAAARIGRSPHRALFIHGGHWLAEPIHPAGLSPNSLYGRSSNQEMLNIASAQVINPDDFVFLRPTQTEAVLLQFGDIAVYDGEAIVENWPVLAASA